MSEINDIVGAEFVQLLTTGKLDAICTAFDHFTDKVISFIHKPIHWAEKHICLARLNAIFKSIEAKKSECIEMVTYTTLAISLVATMKALLLQAQGLNPESLVSFTSQLLCANGQPLTWTDGENGLYELINGLHSKGAFNKGEATIADITMVFAAMFNINLTAEGSYETGRRMRARKGKPGKPMFNKANNIPCRDYYIDELHNSVNEKLIEQDNLGDGRKNKKKKN